MANVVLKNVTKIYDGGTLAVRNANIEVKDKEFLVLVGPSGCGKSTTLRMIAGLEDITDGELYIDEELVNNVSPKNRNIAMVFQNYALYPHMTVAENMGFGLKLRKYKKDEIKERVQNAAEILGITELLERKPKALSGGQRQRVAVGRAIVRQPKVFLFDEPLSNLDAKLRVQMRTEISKLHQKLEATMVYVTHDQTEAMTMGDRIVIMKDGDILQIDTPLHLYNHPVNKFVAGFIGSPSMNFIDGKLIEQQGLYFIDEKQSIKVQICKEHEHRLKNYVGKEVTVGIRPENIHAEDSMKSEKRDKIVVTLDVTEPMGNEIFLYFNINGSNTIARIPALKEEEPQPGEEIDLYVDASKMHFFDKQTEKAILI